MSAFLSVIASLVALVIGIFAGGVGGFYIGFGIRKGLGSVSVSMPQAVQPPVPSSASDDHAFVAVATSGKLAGWFAHVEWKRKFDESITPFDWMRSDLVFMTRDEAIRHGHKESGTTISLSPSDLARH